MEEPEVKGLGGTGEKRDEAGVGFGVGVGGDGIRVWKVREFEPMI